MRRRPGWVWRVGVGAGLAVSALWAGPADRPSRPEAAVGTVFVYPPGAAKPWRGAGFLVSRGGLVATCAHVFATPADRAEVKWEDGTVSPIKAIWLDPRRDAVLAVVDAPPKDLAPLPIAPQPPKSGETLSLLARVGSGKAEHVGGLGRGTGSLGQGRTVIRWSGRIDPGMSGSPLLNPSGEAVGIGIGEFGTVLAVPLAHALGLTADGPPLEVSLACARYVTTSKGLSDQAYLRYGNAAAQAGPYAQVLERLVSLDRDEIWTWIRLSGCDGLLGRLKDQIAALKEVLRLDPTLGAAFSNLARAHAGLNAFPESLEAAERAIALDPWDPVPRTHAGCVHLAERRFEDAIAAFHGALKVNPAHAGAHENLGTAYFGLNRFEDAVTSYREAVRLNPRHLNGYRNLALTCERLGRLDEAVAAMQTAVGLNPNDPQSRFQLGELWVKTGRLDEARKAQEVLRSLSPSLAKRLEKLIPIPASGVPAP